MELILQRDLPHQQKAVDAICAALNCVSIAAPIRFYENPIISLSDPRITENIRSLQKELPAEYRTSTDSKNCLNLDIKMETGTGKTYVYTKTMFELHKRYGMNKFIIAVPSLAIKAGTAQFLTDEYARRHFSDGCGYGTEMEVGVLEASKKQKGRRSYFPSVVGNFIRGSCQNAKKIYVLLVNMQLLTGAKILSRNDYDYGTEGFYRPIDAICATRPIVIIDEPHRFTRSQKAFVVITDDIKPQCVIRFGATFPEISSGRGKNKITVKDYANLLYDLNACESFNQNLIKGVIKEHFEPVSKREEKVKIISMENREVVSFQFKKRGEATRTFKLKTNDPLSIISNGFEGITITAVTASTVKFSNGIEKTVGEEMDVEIYMTSYQEQMIRLALQRHFEAEKENFCGRSFKIKSLALFFIDDITSYRSDKEEKSPYLLLTFERLLKEQIKAVIATLDEYNAEYREYLQTSLNNIAACHAGYFSNDNSDSDEDIAREVDAILHGKKRLLSFKNADDSYNTLRFLFSKWTLKEGWDNPNIFTIAKLRSSGSENSKLQEVGRGLRLPVDENGNRISNEEFYLNYIVDFTEADFAQRLVEQINGELPLSSVISEKKLEQVAKKLGFSSDDLFDALYSEHYIDRHLNIKTETRDAFFTKYPDFATGLTSGKVKDLNKTKAKPVKIRPAVYSEIKELWQILNQRYLLFYDTEVNVNEKVGSAVLSILEQGVFTDAVISSNRETIKDQGGQITAITGAGVQYTVMRPIAYNAFLTRISRATNIPIAALHNGMCEYTKKHGSIDSRYINENSAAAFIHGFQEWRNSELQTRFRYVKSGSPVGATALSYGDGSPRESIAQGRIGTKIIPGTPSAKYLYDVYAYDSPLEKNNIIADIEEVVVFGKIPRSSISIPTITGGMYSPDFMYVVRRKHDKPQLNIVVETKGVEDKDELRGVEKVKMGCARIFFDNLKAEGYDVVFREQLNNKAIRQIISEVMADDGIWNNVCRERI